MKIVFKSADRQSGDTTSFHFLPEHPVDYIAGQFAEFSLPHDDADDRGIRRQITLSSSPTEELVAVTVKFADISSSFKRALNRLQPGDSLSMSEPMGDFVLPLDESRPLVWIAGGIGITPFRSMARWMSDSGEKRHIRLFHSVRDRSEVLFTDIISAAGIAEQDITETSFGTRLTAQSILDQAGDSDDKLYYISGPEAMAESFAHDLAAHGISRDRIVTDAFLGYK